MRNLKLDRGCCNADNSKPVLLVNTSGHEGSKYMSWTILITYQNECAHVYSYRKLLLLRESGRFLVEFHPGGCGVFATPERTNHALNPKCGPQPQELLHQISAGGDHHRQKGHSLFEKKQARRPIIKFLIHSTVYPS